MFKRASGSLCVRDMKWCGDNASVYLGMLTPVHLCVCVDVGCLVSPTVPNVCTGVTTMTWGI